MSVSPQTTPSGIDSVLVEIERGAAQRDAEASPAFPRSAFERLQDGGLLAFNATEARVRPPAAGELDLVRRVAAADASVGRIFDGHLNAVERLAVHAPPDIRGQELARVRAGEIWAGVWGGEPRDGEGPPARLRLAGGERVLSGVKTFCSGAGGLNRALVLAHDERDGDRMAAVWVDPSDPRTVEIDQQWYRSHGLAASASHRVVFHDTPVLAQFGASGSFAAQPWFARDALRTAASWAGIGDSGARAALRLLGEHGRSTQLEELAAGRIACAVRELDVWLEFAARTMDAESPELALISVQARVAVAAACRSVVEEAASACGSWPFVRADALDRAHRDLSVFLLQHRLDPIVARLGSALLDELTAARVGDAVAGTEAG